MLVSFLLKKVFFFLVSGWTIDGFLEFGFFVELRPLNSRKASKDFNTPLYSPKFSSESPRSAKPFILHRKAPLTAPCWPSEMGNEVFLWSDLA